MKKIVLIGGGKKSLVLDILKKNQNNKEDFEVKNEDFKAQHQERKKNIEAKAKIIIEKNKNPFVD